MNQLAATAADLYRVADWIHRGQDQLARQFIQRLTPENPQLSDQLAHIAALKPDRLKASEQALTLSHILYFRSLT